MPRPRHLRQPDSVKPRHLKSGLPGPVLAVLLSLAIFLIAGAGQGTDWADCLSCHPGYSSELPRLQQLRRSGLGSTLGTSCEECHDTAFLSRPQLDWSHPVRPIGAHLDCTQCHIAAPHGLGDPPPMPLGDYGAGCFDCHAEVEQDLHSYSRHSIDLRTRCISCHPPHAALRAGLAIDLLPRKFQRLWSAAFDQELSNGTCLACHSDPALFSSLTSGFVTYNTINYHELHVREGQNLCIECHDAHGSQRAYLLRSELLSGDSMAYFEQPRGASCTVSCHGVEHRSLQYIRRVD